MEIEMFLRKEIRCWEPKMTSVYTPRMCLGCELCLAFSSPTSKHSRSVCAFPNLHLFPFSCLGIMAYPPCQPYVHFHRGHIEQELGLFNLRESISNYGIPGTMTRIKEILDGGGGGEGGESGSEKSRDVSIAIHILP